jgi:predicted metal-dependent hydrolase
MLSNAEINITYVKSVRAKRLSVTIGAFKPIRVTFPARVSQTTAEEFLKSKMEWVKKTVNKMKEIELQTSIQPTLPKINKNNARITLTTQLKLLADKHKFSYNRVFIRNQKTRWGSCSCKNNINLNVNLVRLPGELLDYVLIHELVHTRIKNHSKRFWAELDKYVGQARAMARKLRKHSLNMFHCAA